MILRYRQSVPKGSSTVLEIAGREVTVSNPDKVMFPKRGETKLDTIEHYLHVAEPLMRTMGGRPVLMQRFPNGVKGKSFFQKRVPESRPEWLQTAIVSTPNGTTSDAMVAADLAHVAWAVNLGCLGFHVWPVRVADEAHTDELRFDLDPTTGVTFDMVRETAYELKTLFDEYGIVSFPKTSGSKGLHIYVRLEPRWDSYDVRLAAVAVARELERRRPDLITAAWWKEERGTRVFVDFNQNSPHKTVFGALSVRARVGAQVSTPLAWAEVADVDPDELTIPVIAERVSTTDDPWLSINDHPQSLKPLLDLHRADVERGLPDAPWPPQYPKMPNEPPRVAPSRAKKD